MLPEVFLQGCIVSIRNKLTKVLNRESISYLICGGCTTILGLGIFSLAVFWGVETAIANTIATVIAVCFAYVVNKTIVFQSKNWRFKSVIREFAKFCSARFFTFASETALLLLLIDVLGFHSVLSKGFTSALVIVGNYMLSKWVVFRKKA